MGVSAPHRSSHMTEKSLLGVFLPQDIFSPSVVPAWVFIDEDFHSSALFTFVVEVTNALFSIL